MIDVNKDVYSISDFRDIMRLLRSENGCKWDKEQTHESIRSNFIEETYEVCEAIDCKDSEMLKEELGDVLLQVLFHAQMEEEAGRFTFEDVVTDICKKLIVRHPHVFGDVKVSGTEEILKNWNTIKQKAKGQTTSGETLISVPKQLPALMRSQKVQQRAKKANKRFGHNSLEEVCGDLYGEIEEFKEVIDGNDREKIADELGDVMFASVNVARYLGFDSEELLTASCNKFVKRFCRVEELALSNGIDLSSASDEELDDLWKQAKKSLL